MDKGRVGKFCGQWGRHEKSAIGKAGTFGIYRYFTQPNGGSLGSKRRRWLAQLRLFFTITRAQI